MVDDIYIHSLDSDHGKKTNATIFTARQMRE